MGCVGPDLQESGRGSAQAGRGESRTRSGQRPKGMDPQIPLWCTPIAIPSSSRLTAGHKSGWIVRPKGHSRSESSRAHYTPLHHDH